MQIFVGQALLWWASKNLYHLQHFKKHGFSSQFNSLHIGLRLTQYSLTVDFKIPSCIKDDEEKVVSQSFSHQHKPGTLGGPGTQEWTRQSPQLSQTVFKLGKTIKKQENTRRVICKELKWGDKVTGSTLDQESRKASLWRGVFKLGLEKWGKVFGGIAGASQGKA